MHIKGLQKLTLLDYPEKLAATVFTGGCNLRCPFCHNASLVLENIAEIDESEVLSFLKKRQGILEGVCITGGEPLLQRDLEDFIIKVKALGYSVKLDTNGSLPDKLSALLSKNLVDYVAMDIKNSPEKYFSTCGIKAQNPLEFYSPFKKSIEIIKNSGVKYEFRTTVVSELHTLSDIEKIGAEIRGAAAWHLQCFKDSGDLILKDAFTAPEKETLLKMQQIAGKFAVKCDIRGV